VLKYTKINRLEKRFMSFEDRFSVSMPEYYAPLPSLSMALERMGLDPNGDYSPSKENIHKRMLASTATIPLEALDCSDYRRKLDISPPHLFDKIVLNNRGGYCYEINGFFMAVLEELGYECIPLAGRLLFGNPVFGPMRHRMTIAVIDGKRYLCDVGYGSGIADGPVDIDSAEIQLIGENRYAVERHDGGKFGDFTLVRHMDDGSLSYFYTAYLKPYSLFEFLEPNEQAEITFRTRRVCRLRTDTGSIAVDGKVFRRKDGDQVEEIEITSYPQLYKILVDEFNMKVPRMSFSNDWPREFADYGL
jgi:N-hydroxyarylamine O-acetyltransferase